MTEHSTSTHVTLGGRREPDLRSVVRMLLRGRWVIIGTMTAAVLIAVVVTWLQPRVYESEATVRIDEEQQGLSLLTRMAPIGLGGMAGLGGSDVQTDIAELRSRRIAEQVVDSLHLQVRLTQPDTARDALVRVIQIDRGADEATIRLTMQENGTYRVTAEGRRVPVGAPPVMIRPGEEFSIAGAVLLVEPSAGASPSQMMLKISPFQEAVEQVRKSMRVDRPDPTAKVVAIRYRDRDPVLTAAVPNAATTIFLRYKTETIRERSHGTVDFLQEQIAHYSPALAAAEARLQQYREDAQIISPTDQASEELRRAGDLHVRRDMLRTEQHSLRELLQRVGGSPGASDSRSLYRDLAAHPLFLANGAVQDVLRSLGELETERSTLAVRRTDENLDIQAIDARVAELEDQLLRMARGYLRSLDTQIASMDGILVQSQYDLGTIPAREAEFLRLTREQKLLEEVLLMLQTKLKEEEIQASSETTTVRALDTALEPEGPVSPRPLLNLLVALMVGTVVGVGLAFGRDLMDDAVRSEDEVRSVTGGAPVVGMIPDTGGGTRAAARRSMPRWLLAAPLQLGGSGARSEVHAFREIATAMRIGEPGGPRTVVITDAGEGAGKVAVARGMALQLARRGRRVLLVAVDAHGARGIDPDPRPVRLTEVRDVDDFHRTLERFTDQETGVQLDVLRCDGVPAGEPLEPWKLGDLVQRFGGGHDAIIVDAPSLSYSGDAAVLGRYADSTLVVAQIGRTDRDALARAVTRLEQLEVPFGGIVLTDPEVGQNGSTPFALPRNSEAGAGAV
ncbi:N/A [soil metagenome]